MRSNQLQLNIANAKTSRHLHQLLQSPLSVGYDHVSPASAVPDLGIHIHSNVSMRSHVAKTVSTCVNCRLSVVQCRDLFFSRYCRLLFSRGWSMAIRHTLAFHHISRHGCSLMNATAHLIFSSSKFQHITLLLCFSCTG